MCCIHGREGTCIQDVRTSATKRYETNSIGATDWLHSAQDMTHWLYLANLVMNIIILLYLHAI
jgi:hypothetical protein